MFILQIPSLFATLGGTEYDYKYRGLFDKGIGKAHKDHALPMQRGKVLGGSSAVNYLVYSRGVPKDYDHWNTIAPGWSWDEVLPYFKKLENMTDPTVFSEPENAVLHSTEGPVGVSRPEDNAFNAEVNQIMLKSYAEMGLPTVLENNGPEIYGVARPHYTFANGRRSSTAEAYLRPNKDRPNLSIATHSRVIKILIDETRMQATGVRILNKDGNIINVFASIEVIVSAGTIDSPKLLMLSGIGPKEDLQRIGIKTLVDLPVGLNMQDHAFAPMTFVGKWGLRSAIVNVLVPTQLDSFPLPFQSGFWTLNMPSSRDLSQKPMFQFFNFFIGATAALLVKFGCRTYGFTDDFCWSVAKNNFYREIDESTIILLHPLSRGKVSLQNSNPLEDPIIETGLLREEEDVLALREAVKFMRQLENTTYFQNIDGYLAKLEVPGCEGYLYGTNEYWDCYVRGTVGSMLHVVGTCAMGPDGVVDERLKVHGIDRLRVVDASIMPKIPSGNTNAPAMMIGEKAADMIKEDYGVPIESLGIK